MKGEKEKCRETKDKCICEIYKIIMEIDSDERNRIIMEYLNIYKISNKAEKFLLSLIF